MRHKARSAQGMQEHASGVKPQPLHTSGPSLRLRPHPRQCLVGRPFGPLVGFPGKRMVWCGVVWCGVVWCGAVRC
eukprot:14168141-Alexandrium_andersonii.AAC.1